MSKTNKYHVDPQLYDLLMTYLSMQVTNLLDSAVKARPEDVTYAAATIGGYQQALRLIYKHMTEECQNGITIRQPGQGTVTGGDAAGGDGSQIG